MRQAIFALPVSGACGLPAAAVLSPFLRAAAPNAGIDEWISVAVPVLPCLLPAWTAWPEKNVSPIDHDD